MKKIITVFSIFYFTLVLAKTSVAQHTEKCGFNHLIEYNNQKSPGYKAQVEAIYNNLVAKANSKQNQNSKVTYTIPVVFHVVWNSSNPTENLHDSVLLEQIAVLNEDFSRTNADTSNTRAEFLPIVGDAEIQFALACRDTNGNFTNGIVRVETDSTFGGGFLPDMESIGKIQRTAQGGSDAWRPTEYLNIWIGDINGGASSPSLLGIATPPAGLSNWPANSVPPELKDGAIIQYNAFGRNNPVATSITVINGRTVTHEVGHYLGVRHTAENTFGGLFGSICGDDDGLTDTPTCDQSAQGCDMSRNSCVDAIPGTTGDVHDMVENYMDYSDQDCQNSFTVGQTLIMQDVIQNYRSGLINSPAFSNCTSSIDENELENAFSIYPNPSNGIISINNQKNLDYKLNVINSVGQEVPHAITNNNQINIDSKGIYFIKISTQTNSIIKKIIIQ